MAAIFLRAKRAPSSLAFVLRPSTFSFAGFPSVNRHSIAAPIPGAFLAVNAYLDNPMFFYGHTEDFENGPASFNTIADDVNRLQPDTRWAGLGEISTHMYLTRVREDADYDVLALANHFCVTNSALTDATFHVQKEEVGTDRIDSVLADGHAQPYEIKDGQLILSIKIPKGAAKCIAVQYGKDMDLSSVVIGHDSAEAYLLRMASDFRDIYLSKIPGGLTFIRFYNAHEIKPISVLGFGFAFLGLCIYGGYRLRIFARTETSRLKRVPMLMSPSPNGVPVNKTRYCIITPVRDEEEFIAKTFESVVAQTITPCQWIIVDDGSSDRTPQIIDDFARRYSWITALHRKKSGVRSTGGGIGGFLFGLEQLQTSDWQFLVNLDGDLSFAPDYFEKCFEEFTANPKLGITGGMIYNKIGDRLVPEKVAEFHVRGATKVYRRECWDSLGGMWNGLGWDTIDEVKANLRGWETRSLPDLPLTHYRFTGTACGKWWGHIKNGQADYIVGYHPLFFCAKFIRRLFGKHGPRGAIGLAYGWLGAHWKQMSRVEDPEFVGFVRRQQMRRLLGQSSPTGACRFRSALRPPAAWSCSWSPSRSRRRRRIR